MARLSSDLPASFTLEQRQSNTWRLKCVGVIGGAEPWVVACFVGAEFCLIGRLFVVLGLDATARNDICSAYHNECKD